MLEVGFRATDMLARVDLSADRRDGQNNVRPTHSGKHVRNCFSILSMLLLITHAMGCGILPGTPPADGKIVVHLVSWKLVKKLAEPDAGLSGRKVTILNPADRSVVAAGTTDGSGLLEFDLPAGNYILVGASDEPQSIQVQAGQTLNLKLVVHEGAAPPSS
jgi:hypothetical protein